MSGCYFHAGYPSRFIEKVSVSVYVAHSELEDRKTVADECCTCLVTYANQFPFGFRTSYLQ